MNNFYSKDELFKIGFKKIGENVLLSKKSSIYDPDKMIIGSNVRIDDFCVLTGNIKIGNYVHIAPFCGLYGGAGIELCDFVGISSRVSIYSVSDDYSGEFMANPTIIDKYRNVQEGKVVLEKHVIVGASSIILPGVTVKEGTAIGAMSLITKDTDGWHQYIGSIPAKKIKVRSKRILNLEKEMLDNT